MVEVTGDEDFQAAHIFVEADVEDKEPLKAYMTTQHNILYAVISSFKPVTIEQLPFEKGPKVQRMNGMLLGAMKAMIKATKSTLDELNNENAKILQLKEEYADKEFARRKELIE